MICSYGGYVKMRFRGRKYYVPWLRTVGGERRYLRATFPRAREAEAWGRRVTERLTAKSAKGRDYASN